MEEDRAARGERYAQRLARMLQLKTIYQEEEGADGADRGPHEGEFAGEFEKFRALVRELFPLLHEKCEFECVGGTLLYRWRGATEKGALALMSHHDVVEAGGEWSHEPFGGEIADGRVWGRGALDIKGNLFCIMQAVEELLEAGYEPAQDVHVISSNCEEKGGNDLVADLLAERGADISVLVDEGSPMQPFPAGGVEGEGAFVALGEKGSAKVRCIARGTGGHPMLPGRRSPLPRLGAFMAEIDEKGLVPVRMNPLSSAFLARLANLLEGERAEAARALAACEDVADPALLDAVDPALRDVIGTTVAFTLAHGADAAYTMPTEAWVLGNVRIATGNSVEEVMDALNALAERHDLEIKLEKSGEPSPAADPDGEGMARIERALAVAAPGVPMMPFMLAGGTDTKHFLKLCECVRFTALHISSTQQPTIHGIDENVDVDTLPRGVDFFKALIRDDGALA